MNANTPEDDSDEFVLVATIAVYAADRVAQLLLDAGIEPGGGGSRGVVGIMVEREHQATAKDIIKKDAEAHGYARTICSDR